MKLSKVSFKNFRKAAVLKQLAVVAIVAILANMYIEIFARFSVVKAMQFFVSNPLITLANVLLIFAVLSACVLFKRWVFSLAIISSFWIILGTVNGVLLTNRMTPFTTKDIRNVVDGFSIVTNYLSVKVIALSIAAVVIVLLFFIFLFKKGKKLDTEVPYRRNLVIVIMIIGIMLGSMKIFTETGVLQTFFGNLAYAYRDNGVPYGFMTTWVNDGISKPDDYSKELIDKIIKKSKPYGENNKKKKPNIIFLQLESFIDPTNIKGVKLSQDPIPYYRKLMKEYSSGLLTVPAVGAGTSNTEYEAITGKSVRFFGPGEYPYKSILQEKTCESLPYILKKQGYKSHAIHNHRGGFYDRNKVFSKLGFDTFTSLEYMNGVSSTPKGWARDDVLLKYIMKALKSTKGSDYIYTISVQGHGKYPEERILGAPKIKALAAEPAQQKWAYEYYSNQINEMDEFVKQLTAKLKKLNEDVVLVMYGDHIPAIEVDEKQIKHGNVFNTQYVIWDNMGLKKQDKNIHAYNLAADVLKRINVYGNSDSIGFNYAQGHSNDKDYLKNLKALAYDELYGNRYLYEGKSGYSSTNLQMGIDRIYIDKIVKIDKKYYIKGNNFTPYSKVSLNGKVLNTIYLDPTRLGLLEEIDPALSGELKISQVEKGNKILSTTE